MEYVWTKVHELIHHTGGQAVLHDKLLRFDKRESLSMQAILGN